MLGYFDNFSIVKDALVIISMACKDPSETKYVLFNNLIKHGLIPTFQDLAEKASNRPEVMREIAYIFSLMINEKFKSYLPETIMESN